MYINFLFSRRFFTRLTLIYKLRNTSPLPLLIIKSCLLTVLQENYTLSVLPVNLYLKGGCYCFHNSLPCYPAGRRLFQFDHFYSLLPLALEHFRKIDTVRQLTTHG